MAEISLKFSMCEFVSAREFSHDSLVLWVLTVVVCYGFMNVVNFSFHVFVRSARGNCSTMLLPKSDETKRR